jgi:hypothetical protein
MADDTPLTLEQEAEKFPFKVILNADNYFRLRGVTDDKRKEAITRIAFDAAEKGKPGLIYDAEKLLATKPYAQEIRDKTLAHLKADPEKILEISSKNLVHFFKDHPELKEAAFRARAQTHGEDILNNAAMIAGQPYEKEVLRDAAYNLANSSDSQYFLFKQHDFIKSKLPEDFERLMRTGFETAAKGETPDVVFQFPVLLEGKPYADEVKRDALMTGSVTNPEDALRNSQFSKGKSYEAVVGVALASISTDETAARKVVDGLNMRHMSDAPERFRALQDVSAATDFDLMTYGRDNAYNSTYAGLLDDLKTKLKSSGKTLTESLDDRQQDRLPLFVEAAAAHNRLKEIKPMIPEDAMPGLVEGMMDRMAKSSDIKDTTAVYSVMMAYKDDDKVRPMLEASMKQHFDNSTGEEKDRFGLLASAFQTHSNKTSPDLKTFYLGIKSNPKFALHDFSTMTKGQLVDGKGVSNQLMLFPGLPGHDIDPDTVQSFNSWQDTYRGQKGWKIEDKGRYVEISSTSGKVPVHIFGNKPGQLLDALDDIKAEVAKRQGTDKATFQQASMRGHLFYTDGLIKFNVTPDMKLVELGNCEGYDKVKKVLDKSPDAQIVYTQGTGDITVNDPLMREINKSINKDGEINWRNIHKELDKLSPSFSPDYLLPDTDIYSAMSKRYNELHPPVQAAQTQSQKQSSLEERYRVEDVPHPLAPPAARAQLQPDAARTV